jgi:hypothetical protein
MGGGRTGWRRLRAWGRRAGELGWEESAGREGVQAASMMLEAEEERGEECPGLWEGKSGGWSARIFRTAL